MPEVDQFILTDNSITTIDAKEEKILESKELQIAWKLFSSEEFKKSREISSEYIKNDDLDLKIEALRLTGLTYYRTFDFKTSEILFQELCEISNFSIDWFYFSIILTQNSKFDKSDKSFSKAIDLRRLSRRKDSVSIPFMRFEYLLVLNDNKQYELAYEQLLELSEYYIKYQITDGTFLYMREVPFFENMIDSSKIILEHIPHDKSRSWIKKMRKSVDEYGVEYLTKFEKTLKIN
ncbi:hypothetical protein [Nonlabens sp. Asnod3-A02]|uniref:hypothetical protein n=1 Tax=Nonlabens sp. Asnod3-A02 TaxID=3160579 RepID=UPI003869E2A2